MSDMFGSPIGERAYDEDLLKTTKGAVDIQHTLGDIAMQPAELRLKSAQAGKAELELQQHQQMQQLMQRSMTPGGEPGSGRTGGLADKFDSLAEMAAGSGLVDQAQKLALSAATLRSRGAAALNQKTQQQLNVLKAGKAQADFIGQMFGGAKDAQSWQRANDQYEFQTQQPSPYRNIEYSPELVTSLNNAAMTAKQRLDEEEKKIQNDDTATYREARLKQHDVENKIRQINADLAKAREDRLAKAGGGKSVSSPAKGELDQVSRMIKRDYETMELADTKDAAYAIASEAKALRRANPALDANMALQQAYQNARAAGDFQTQERLGGLRADLAKYVGGGKTPATALPVPGNPANAVKGRYYVNSKGVVAQWNGTKFVVGGNSRPLSSDNSRADSEPDEEDDDNEGDE